MVLLCQTDHFCEEIERKALGNPIMQLCNLVMLENHFNLCMASKVLLFSSCAVSEFNSFFFQVVLVKLKLGPKIWSHYSSLRTYSCE